jgi:hypothetical protein
MSVAAFTLALLGLILSVLSFGWQLASWALGGRRVSCRLVMGNLTASGVTTAPVKSDGRAPDVSHVNLLGTPGVEVLGIEISNHSRDARVAVESVRAKSDVGISYDPLRTAHGPALPFWLETGQTQSWYIDAQTARALVYTTRRIGKPSTWVTMLAFVGPNKVVEPKTRLVVE